MKTPYDSDIEQKTIAAYYTPGGDSSELRHLRELREGYRRALSDLAPRLEAADALAEELRHLRELREGYRRALSDLAPRLEAADALAEAVRTIQRWLMDTRVLPDDGITHPLFIKANNLAIKALAAYDAAKKDPHD